MRLGETILRCEPFACVVHEDFQGHVCDFCLKRNNNNLQRCNACKVAFYCGRDCQKAAWKEDHRHECKFMKEGGEFRLTSARLIARIIVKLRAGKEAVILPNGSCRSFGDLLSHTKRIVQDRELLFSFSVVYADLQKCFKESVPSKEEVLEMFGRHKINSFNIMDASANEAIAMALYLEASVFDHSCSPNAAISFSGRTLFVRSITNDPNLSFEDVRISYTDALPDTATRRAKIREKYYFECTCVACESDPGGLDLLKQGAMRCPRCQSAVHVAYDETDLKCPECSEPLDVQTFKALKAKAVSDVIDNKNRLPRAALDKMTVRYAEDMFKAKFHPYDKTYLGVLEKAVHVHPANAEWKSLLKMQEEIVLAYKGLYPKYNYNTAMMLRNAGVRALDLNLFGKAETFLLEARDILTVTHGEDHPIFSDVLHILSMVQAK